MSFASMSMELRRLDARKHGWNLKGARISWQARRNAMSDAMSGAIWCNLVQYGRAVSRLRCGEAAHGATTYLPPHLARTLRWRREEERRRLTVKGHEFTRQDWRQQRGGRTEAYRVPNANGGGGGDGSRPALTVRQTEEGLEQRKLGVGRSHDGNGTVYSPSAPATDYHTAEAEAEAEAEAVIPSFMNILSLRVAVNHGLGTAFRVTKTKSAGPRHVARRRVRTWRKTRTRDKTRGQRRRIDHE